MKRDIEADLLKWKESTDRLPLLLRGARQVGKTYIIEKFGIEHFEEVLTINFEKQTEFKSCFESLKPKEIIASIELISGKKVVPGKILLFLDEIQECPQAIMALRYFKEEMQVLHVIGAGSLLEFALNDKDFRMPVGRLTFLYLKPLSLLEFLDAMGASHLREYLYKVDIKETINSAVHQHLLQFVKQYTILGGMPAVISKYLSTESFLDAQERQGDILNTFRTDFGKYAQRAAYKNLQLVFEKAPTLVAQWFKYSKVSQDVSPKDIRTALFSLYDAGLLYPVHANNASGLPLLAMKNEKKFKLLFLDVGLVKKACGIPADVLLAEEFQLINQGMLAEQFVGQELLAYQSRRDEPQLYFWIREERGSSAEVDYLSVIKGKIVPIEVKSGAQGKLKSLKIFIEEKRSRIGVQISEKPLSFERNILSIPFYLISELPRIVENLL